MAYDDLITFKRLRQANAGNAVGELLEIGPEAKTVISGVSSLIRSRLGRVVIVQKVSQRIAPHDWTDDETTRGSEVRAYADEQPLVEVTSTGDVTASDLSIRTKSTFQAPGVVLGQVDYFAGWRRPGQEMADLPTGSDEALEGLSELPPELPGVFAEVAANVTMHVLKNRDENLGQRSTRTIGGQETVIEGADPGFLDRELSRLSKYDRSHVPR